MLNDLAHRVGQGEHWWDDFEQALDWILEPMGITWQEFKKMDYMRGEVRTTSTRRRGFPPPPASSSSTPPCSKKWGYDPLPQYREPPESPVSTPELYRRLSLHPDHRRPAARLLPHREPPGALAAGTPPGPGGGDPPGHRAQGGHRGGGLGGHRVAPGQDPPAGQALRRHGPADRRRPSTPGGSRKTGTRATAGTSPTSTS